MAAIILIHGAWHGAWCWERVVPLLEQRGHVVIAPDLPGMGQDRTPLAEITLDSWARFVADLIRQQIEPVVLVGHSRGGVVISQAAKYCPERIAKLVYLTAFLVPNGDTLWSTMRQIPRDPAQPPSLVLSNDRSTSTLLDSAIKDTFYSTTSDNLVARASSLVGPEPMGTFVTPLDLGTAFDEIPRVYIECRQDNAIPLKLQKLVTAAMPCRILTIDTDHSPFYSAPELLSDHLADLAAEA